MPVRGDLDSLEAMRSAMAGCGVVFHSAAEMMPWARSWKRHEHVNVQGRKHEYPSFLGTSVVHITAGATLPHSTGSPMLPNGCILLDHHILFFARRVSLAWRPKGNINISID